jgi:hypothetical protein
MFKQLFDHSSTEYNLNNKSRIFVGNENDVKKKLLLAKYFWLQGVVYRIPKCSPRKKATPAFVRYYLMGMF